MNTFLLSQIENRDNEKLLRCSYNGLYVSLYSLYMMILIVKDKTHSYDENVHACILGSTGCITYSVPKYSRFCFSQVIPEIK